MKISLKNIGLFKQTDFELGDFTIICGKNNTGKTYATYALYGFLDFLSLGYRLKIDKSNIDSLFENGTVNIPLESFINNFQGIIDDACLKYKNFIPKILGGQERFFKDSSFSIKINKSELSILETYKNNFKSENEDALQIVKEKNNNNISVSLLLKNNEVSLKYLVSNIISDSIKTIIFNKLFPTCFIASAERTGAAIFKNDLNIEKMRLMEILTSNEEKETIFESINDKLYNINYPLPVRKNLDFIRRLENIFKQDSFILKEYPKLISEFSDILGGDYKVDNNGIWFIPKNTKTKLSINESSSSVRSLLDVGFYLKHIAQKGNILMIDEPELNLHPESQRRLARLLARLVNIGIKVFITTHSDYIIKELNTLIMLNYKRENSKILKMMEENNYYESELISPDKIKVFIACYSLTQIEGKSRRTKAPILELAEINEFYGIEAKSFDNTIDEMNNFQNAIVFER